MNRTRDDAGPHQAEKLDDAGSARHSVACTTSTVRRNLNSHPALRAEAGSALRKAQTVGVRLLARRASSR
jgi:hypothetical protein